MMRRSFSHQTALTIALLALMLLPGVARATVLSEQNIRITSSPTLNRVDIHLEKPVKIRVVDGVDSNDYFFVDIYSTRPDFVDKRFPINDGILRAIETVSYPDLDVVRVVFYPVDKSVFQVSDGRSGFVYPKSGLSETQFAQVRNTVNHIVIDTAKFRNQALAPRAPVVPSERELALAASRSNAFGHKRVVIDPGHGGRDPGAVSIDKINGRFIHEKDVVLAIALELERLLHQVPNVTPILTRDRDEYVSLAQRVQFAEETEGDFFVSIHANATKYHSNNPTARGVQFYYLSETSNPQFRALEAAENRDFSSSNLDREANQSWMLIAQHLANDIMEMQRSFGADASMTLNDVFQTDPYYRANSYRPVRKARYRVLMNRVMPAVLIEVGFMDVKQELVMLVDPAFQQRVAVLIANGILRFFANQDNSFASYQFSMESR